MEKIRSVRHDCGAVESHAPVDCYVLVGERFGLGQQRVSQLVGIVLGRKRCRQQSVRPKTGVDAWPSSGLLRWDALSQAFPWPGAGH